MPQCQNCPQWCSPHTCAGHSPDAGAHHVVLSSSAGQDTLDTPHGKAGGWCQSYPSSGTDLSASEEQPKQEICSNANEFKRTM